MAIANTRTGSNRGLARTLATALGLAVLIGGTAAAPARADDDGWHRHQGWHEHEWRGHEWREHEWREHHRPYAYVYPSYPSYGYAYAPPPVIYAPPPPPPVYYAPPPTIDFVFPIRIH
jgi:hypothetical protein